jgi:hypothetical protein
MDEPTFKKSKQQQEDLDLTTPTLAGIVKRALSLYMYENAMFLSERLYAHSPSEETLHLLVGDLDCMQIH